MGDLKEELLKVGLVDRRALETADHTKWQIGKRKQHAGRRTEEQRSGVKRDNPAQSNQHVSHHFPPDRSPVNSEDVGALLASGRVESVSGNRRFYFVDRRRRIPFLDLNETTARGLIHGTFAIVESEDNTGEDYVVVPAATAKRIRLLNEDLIRFWNRRE